MASETKQPPTNDRVVRLLQELKAQLDDVGKRQEKMARDLARLSKQK